MRRWGWWLVPLLVGSGGPTAAGPDPGLEHPVGKLNVLHHGVVPSDAVDNSAALEAAAELAVAADRTLYFPPGRYGIANGAFDLCSGLHLAGDGDSVSILCAVDGSAPGRLLNLYHDDDVLIEDLGFDADFGRRPIPGDGSPMAVRIVNVSASRRVRIERCSFRDMTHGVVIAGPAGSPSRDVTISDCRFEMQSRLSVHPIDGRPVPAFGVLVPVLAATSVTVAGCSFTGGADDPAGLVPGSSAISVGGGHFEIADNVFTDYHHGGGGIAIHLNETSSFGRVRDNVAVRCGGDNLSIRGSDHEVTGNRLSQSDDQGIACENATRCVFSGNEVDSTRTASIRVLNATACVFRDNLTKDPGSPIGGPAVAAMARSHYHLRNDGNRSPQRIADVTVTGARMTTTNEHTAYGVFVGPFGADDEVTDVLLGDGNVFVTTDPSDTLWGGGAFPFALRVGSVANGRLRDAPAGRPTVAADPDTLFLWNGVQWRVLEALDARARRDRAAPRLGHARPNPFSPHTTLEYVLPEAGPVRLTVHDVAGRLVRVLLDGERRAGSHSATWGGRDQEGGPAAAGAYFVRLASSGGTASRRIVRLH